MEEIPINKPAEKKNDNIVSIVTTHPGLEEELLNKLKYNFIRAGYKEIESYDTNGAKILVYGKVLEIKK